MNRRIYLFAFALLMAACSHEEVTFTEPSVPERPVSETVSLCFRLSGRIAGTRATEEETIRQEEGEVQSLCYAVFKDQMFEVGDKVDLTSRNLQTGTEYLVSNLDKDLFDETTEIFAIANASEELKTTLLTTAAPTLENNLDHPMLAQKVVDYIDMQAKIATYNVLIGNQLKNGKYPTDGNDPKIHFKPASKQNVVRKQYDLTAEGIAFTDFASLIENRNKETDLAKRAIYDIIVEDLECRLPLYQSSYYNNQKTKFTNAESVDKTYSKLLAKDADFTRYVQWHSFTNNENLNTTAATSPSRLIESPFMAGYLALADAPGSIITVRVEHIYSRIWFQFGFTGEIDAPDITIDNIQVEGLPQQTKVFNTSSTPVENNIDGAFSDADATVCISCKENKAQSPFLADLTRTEAPWHLSNGSNEDIPLLHFVPSSPAYNVVCRYPAKEDSNELDKEKRPVRYYLYSYQWGGMTTADDPLITVTYNYEEDGNTVTKRAIARLYDENHDGGKLHHGVLRNYTYKVNGRINTASHDLEVQVIPHDWYHFKVDDIPSFD